MPATLRLGTRASPLALAQARLVRDALLAAHGWEPDAIEIVPMTTVGDAIIDRPLAELGGKALWTQPLDRALRDGAVDLNVHSLKDVETIRPDEIVIAAFLPRGDPRDRLIGAPSLAGLPRGSRVGTSSPRRAAQLRAVRPDCVTVSMRGNVATRLRKVEEGEADATFLAAAGLDRLGESGIGVAISPAEMLPACGQAIVAIEAGAADRRTRDLLAAIDHLETRAAATAERAFLAALGGSCHSPVGVHASGATIEGELLLEDGSEAVRDTGDSAAAGELARALLASGSPALRALFGG